MVLILLSFLSLMTAVYICSLLLEVVLILLAFLSLMTAVYICYHFIGSGSDIVIIPLTDDISVYMCSFTGSGSDIVIIPLTDGSCVYVLFYRKLF
jgi:hypothetical protein